MFRSDLHLSSGDYIEMLRLSTDDVDDDDDDDGDSGVKPPKICPHQADHWSQSILKSWSEGRGGVICWMLNSTVVQCKYIYCNLDS